MRILYYIFVAFSFSDIVVPKTVKLWWGLINIFENLSKGWHVFLTLWAKRKSAYRVIFVVDVQRYAGPFFDTDLDSSLYFQNFQFWYFFDISTRPSGTHFGKLWFLDFFLDFLQYGRQKKNRELSHLEMAFRKSAKMCTWWAIWDIYQIE